MKLAGQGRGPIEISIRTESVEDYDAIRRVTTEAFAASEFGHQGEAQLVDLLRDQCDSMLSLVACWNEQVVGHALFTPVVIRKADRELAGMGLAPISVAPANQRIGIGNALIAAGIEHFASFQCPYIVVLGHPHYYPRFGFQPALQFEITHGFAEIPQDVFFIKAATSDALRSFAGGAAYYREEFGPQHMGK